MVDLTYNGQDYLEGKDLAFVYSPLDGYSLNDTCRNRWGQLAKNGSMCINQYHGVLVSELQPFGGPSNGGTQIVVLGRHFQERGPSILCKFGNLSMVNATYVNESSVLCESPPNPHVAHARFEDHYVEVTLNGEENFLTESRVPFAYYDHNTTLIVSAIYPQAGPKEGGNTITVYGEGFRALGGGIKRACLSVPLNGSTSEEAYGPERTEGSMSTAFGLNKGLGDSRVCGTPDIESTNRGLQCIFGDMPAVHGYLLRISGDNATRRRDPSRPEPDDRIGTALICELPKLMLPAPESHVPGYDERSLSDGAPYDVCVEVTLNGNRTQASRNCVTLTYYDA